jgi:hypothetical protein
MISVVSGPVEFVMPVAFVDGVLRLIPAGIDECERLAHSRSSCQVLYEGRLPELRFPMAGTDKSG